MERGATGRVARLDPRCNRARLPSARSERTSFAQSVARCAGTQDEVASVAALLMGPYGAFITGSDLPTASGTTAAYWYGSLGQTEIKKSKSLSRACFVLATCRETTTGHNGYLTGKFRLLVSLAIAALSLAGSTFVAQLACT